MVRNRNNGAKGPNLAAIGRLIGIAALTVVITLGLAGCPAPNGGGGAGEDGDKDPLTGMVSIDGTLRAGETLCISDIRIDGLSDLALLQLKLNLFWKSGDSADAVSDLRQKGFTSIGENHGETYTLTAADVGKYIVLTIVRAEYNDETGGITSNIIGPVKAALLEQTGSVSITGTAEAGSTLTAEIDSLSGSGVPLYQWKQSKGGDYTDISGATGAAYTPVEADEGAYLMVTVTYDDYKGITSDRVGPVTSRIAITWTEVANSPLTAIDGIVYGNGRFVAYNQHTGMMAYSADGATWTQVSNLPSPLSFLIYRGGKFFANAARSLLYSTDGVTWMETDLSINTVYIVASGNGKFVASDGNRVFYSADGATWTASSPLTTIFPGIVYSCSVQGMLYNSGRFIMLAQHGSWGSAPFFASYMMAASVDGVTWNRISNFKLPKGDGGDSGWGGVISGDSGFATIYSYYDSKTKWQRTLWTSTDGVTWNQVFDPKYTITGLTYGDGKFVAVGRRVFSTADPFWVGDFAWYSTSAGAWGEVVLNRTGPANPSIIGSPQGVTYGGGKFVIYGYGTTAYSDTAGWRRTAAPFDNSDGITGIAYGGGRFIAYNTQGRIAYSNTQE